VNAIIDRQIRINIQTHDLQDAISISQLFPDRIVVGVTAKSFPDLDQAIELAVKMQENGVLVSAGLGDGSPDQWHRTLSLALGCKPFHTNQIFSAAGLTLQALQNVGAKTIVNSLIRPSDIPGKVCISTGPSSSKLPDEPISAELAIELMHEIGVPSVKIFPMQGLTHLETFKEIASQAGKREIMVEPTGGITVDMLPLLLEAALEARNINIMPHLYSSVRNTVTGKLDTNLIAIAIGHLDNFLVRANN
jgi:2-dehydro-3-deoxy-phosphogluconate aldolase